MINGVMMGFVWIVINCLYALGFWYGWTLTIKNREKYSVGTIIIVFYNIIISVFNLGNAAPFLGTFANSRAAAYEVFKIIDRVRVENPYFQLFNKISFTQKSKINHDEEGQILKSVRGDVEFRNVEFRYPARDDVKILNNLNLKVKSGQTIALVGASGSGKSTCIQLIQRFYDPIYGSILFDGIDLTQLNLKWLRTQIGVVNQEPILFATTIAVNIRMGREDVTQEEIEIAAKNANAHEFIMNLPEVLLIKNISLLNF